MLDAEESLRIARYVSPEQAGSLDQDMAEPSDLYAAGVVLYESLVGKPPFTATDAGTVLFEHLTLPVPALRSVGVESPCALDEVVQRLLRKDPRDRYQSARAVLVDLEAVAASRARGSAIRRWLSARRTAAAHWPSRRSSRGSELRG